MPRIEIACTLNDGERRTRGDEWRAAVDAGLSEREPIEGGIRLRFAPDAELAHRLEELVAGERACCSWADWQLRRSPDATVVEVTAPGDGAAALRAMFEVA